MLYKNLPSSACLSCITKIKVPTVLGTLLILALKVPDVINTATTIKAGIDTGIQMASDLNDQIQYNKRKE